MSVGGKLGNLYLVMTHQTVAFIPTHQSKSIYFIKNNTLLTLHLDMQKLIKGGAENLQIQLISVRGHLLQYFIPLLSFFQQLHLILHLIRNFSESPF